MKIRITGTKSECLGITNLFAEIAKNSNTISSLEISGQYPNRNSINVYRVYIDVKYEEANNDDII